MTRTNGNGAARPRSRVEAATGLPEGMFDRCRRELAAGGDTRAVAAMLALRAAALRVETRLAEWLAPHGLTPAKFNLLMILWAAEGRPLSMAGVGRAMVSSPGNATKLVGQLERDGLVRRDTHPESRRSVLARLTPAGERLVARVAPPHTARIEAAMNVLTPHQCDCLLDLLGSIRAGFAPDATRPVPAAARTLSVGDAR